jgi:FKBP-type peptidyl-prolyl cis-trans isomerase (trigger factor)
LKVSAEKNIKLVFAIEKIAKELDIKVSESDIEEYFTKVSKLYNQTIENVKEQYKNNMANVEGFIFQKKVFDKLYKVYQEKK